MGACWALEGWASHRPWGLGGGPSALRPRWLPVLRAALFAPSRNRSPLQPRQVPRGEVFRPHGRHLEYLEPVDFLGKAKVKGGGFLLLGPKAQGQRRRQAAGWTARPC